MWNSFLDKAIKAAEVLDKQLNESVGVTTDGDRENVVSPSFLPIVRLPGLGSTPEDADKNHLEDGDWDIDDNDSVKTGKYYQSNSPDDLDYVISEGKSLETDTNHQDSEDGGEQNPERTVDDAWESKDRVIKDMKESTNKDILNEPQKHQTSGAQLHSVFVDSHDPHEGDFRHDMPQNVVNTDDKPIMNKEVESYHIVERHDNFDSVKDTTVSLAGIPDTATNDIWKHDNSKTEISQQPLQISETLTIQDIQDNQLPSSEASELVCRNELKIELSSIAPVLHADQALESQQIQMDCNNLTEFSQEKTNQSEFLERQLYELIQRLELREQQLEAKNQQLAEIQAAFQQEREELTEKVQSTKEEAKRRISKAKERVDILEKQVHATNTSQAGMTELLAQKDEIILALRSEGEKLARKQAEMEKAVRNAKSETREIRESLERNVSAKEEGILRIQALESELASVKEALAQARKGESQADKLDNELRQTRDESERRQATIISLEQNVKELKSDLKNLHVELENAKKGAAVESEHERKKMMKEQNELVNDLENTIRIIEREAAVREDALRHEVEEIRKRWQDSVRRADALSIDIQSSTAPLLRQLDSVNKQNRARASAWAELETQLRTELEDNIVQNEQLTKERNDLKIRCTRFERLLKEKEEEFKRISIILDEKSLKTDQLESKLIELEEESIKKKNEWAEVERLANEGISRVRSEMTKTAVESEERFRSQIEMLKADLHTEREVRRQLELQVNGLLENAGALFVAPDMPSQVVIEEDSKPKKLRQSEGQVSILSNTLSGLLQESDDENEQDDNFTRNQTNGGSFAALDQLTSSLKAAKQELKLLRTRLEDSEKAREVLVETLAECRSAKEKLPLFEMKVIELTEKNLELSQEVSSLREDIADVRELYRTQLNLLIEQKALSLAHEGVNNEEDTLLDAEGSA